MKKSRGQFEKELEGKAKEVIKKLDEHTHKEIEAGRAKNNTNTAYLGEPEGFGQRVWAEAKRRGWTSVADT